jgi:hypothetical protein
MPTKLQDDVRAKSEFEECRKEVQDYASTLLGGISHICTNDFRGHEGAIIWTDHGPKHSERIIELLNVLFDLQKVKARNISVEEKCALLCAAYLHDVGMFVRHPNFPDLDVQRKYHGMVARYLVPYIPLQTHKRDLKKRLTNMRSMIAEICELHQASTGCVKVAASENSGLLGNLLLLADALDISKKRVDEGLPLKSMVENFTTISPMSDAEWWVNSSVEALTIDVGSGKTLHVKVTASAEALREWYGRARPNWNQKMPVLVTGLRDYIKRYLDVHWSAVKKRKDADNPIQKLVINMWLGGECWDDKLLPREILPYDEPQKFMVDHLNACVSSNAVLGPLRRVMKAAKADHVYLFVYDAMEDAIRYVANDAVARANWGTPRVREKKAQVMSRQRVPNKHGIIGHVAYCGIAEDVEDLGRDPRRCLAAEDKNLGLRAVMFYPLIAKNQLYGVVMVNKTKGHYTTSQVKTFKRAVEGQRKRIVKVLNDCSQPYMK